MGTLQDLIPRDFFSFFFFFSFLSFFFFFFGGGGGEVATPLYGLCRYVGPQRVGFSAVLVTNRLLILAILVHFGHK